MSRPLDVSKHKLTAVVLAAGASTRLGRPKQLLRCRSIPLLVRAVRLARGVAGDRVVVVIGSESHRMRTVLNRFAPDVTVVNNARWPEGLASSLRAGVRAVGTGAAGVLCLLVDQPAIGPPDLAALVAAWARCPRLPAAARYSGRLGVPAIIPRPWFRQLAAQRGDIGARALLRGLSEVRCVDMPSAALDIDTLEDAMRLGY